MPAIEFVYLPVLAASIVIMVPAILLAERGGHTKDTLLATILLIAVSQLSLLFCSPDPIVIVVALVIHFTGFNVMEALLPSLITKVAPANAKGTAAGEFLGIFTGGALGGVANAAGGMTGIFGLTLIIALSWFAIATTLWLTSQSSSFLIRISRASKNTDSIGRLKSVSAAADAVVDPQTAIAHRGVGGAARVDV